MSIEEKRQKAEEVLNSLRGLSYFDIKEIITFYCKIQLDNDVMKQSIFQ